MKLTIACLSIALFNGSAEACSLSHAIAEKIYQGATVQSIQAAVAPCEVRMVSSFGFGENAGSIYEAVDARGSILMLTMNSQGRLRTFNLVMMR